ncbi:MAG TPA: TIGR03067 domain-containing protein [Gemmatales bacterium]|nr:TIGR03067 domain-containing protein [Gemmatales bacterium]HMP60656.1 TIGR03067 domain-containing protein [Gemmatales bacterium]
MRWLTWTAVLLMTTAVWAHAHRSTEEDPLVGVWTLETLEVNGEPQAVAGIVFECKPGTYTLKAGDQLIEAGKYKLDAKADPKTIDLEITEGDDKGKKQLGIWKKDGAALVLCFGFPAADVRPKEFTAAKDSNQIMARLKKKAN